MKLNRRHNYIRVSNDAPKLGERVNWGKYAYIGALAILTFVGIYYLIVSQLYITGTGQVIFNKLFVQHTDDIRVVEIFVKEGDVVKKGDKLFTYIESGKDSTGGVYVDGGGTSTADIDREIARAEQGINSKAHEIKGLRSELAILKAEYDNLKKEVLLEAYMPERLTALSKAQSEISLAIEGAEGDIKIQRDFIARLKELRGQKLRRASTFGASGNGGGAKRIFYSMVDGVITRIYASNHEVVLHGDSVMDIHKPEEINIKAFFDQEDINYLKTDLTVDVKFPDGTESKGRIARYYFATVPLPPEFQKRYEPVKRSVAADIVPLTPEDASLWKSFFKMSVELYVSRLQ